MHFHEGKLDEEAHIFLRGASTS